MLTTSGNSQIDIITHQHFNRESFMQKTYFLLSLGLLLAGSSMTFGSQTEVTVQEQTEPCVCPVPRPSPLPEGEGPQPEGPRPQTPDPDIEPLPDTDPEQ